MRRISIVFVGCLLPLALVAAAGAAESRQLGTASKEAATNAKQSGKGSGQSAPPSGQNATALKQFVSADGRFSVRMPGAPTTTTDQVPLDKDHPEHTVPLYTFYVETENKNADYMVFYNDYPPDMTLDPPQLMLQHSRDGLAAGKTLVSDAAISLNGVPGRAFVVHGPDGYSYDIHQYFVGRRLYQVMVVTMNDYVGKDRDAFVNSFTIGGDTDLKLFASADGRFSVLMPGDPKADSTAEPIGSSQSGQTTTLYSFTVTTESDNVAYLACYNDYPPDVATDAPDAVLQRARDGASSGKTLLTDTVLDLNGVPGRAFSYQDADGSLFDHREYFIGRRLYQLIIVTSKNYTAKDRDAFMSSFTITQ